MIWEPCSLRIFICRFWQRKDFGGNPPIWNYQTLWHLPVAAIATFPRIGGRGQQRIVEKCQGVFQMRCEALF